MVRKSNSEERVSLFDPDTHRWVQVQGDVEPQEGTLRLVEEKIYSFRDYNVASFSVYEDGAWRKLTRQEVLERFGPHAAGLVFTAFPTILSAGSLPKAPYWLVATHVLVSHDLQPLFQGLGAFTVIRGYGMQTRITAFDWSFYLPPDRLDEFVRRVEAMGGMVHVSRPWEGADEKVAQARALADEVDALTEQAEAIAGQGNVEGLEAVLKALSRKIPELEALRGEIENIARAITGWPEHIALLTRLKVVSERVRTTLDMVSGERFHMMQERLARKAAAALDAAGSGGGAPLPTGLAAVLSRHPDARQLGEWLIVPLFHGLVVAVRGNEVLAPDALLSQLDEEGRQGLVPVLAEQARVHKELATRYRDLVVMLLKGEENDG